jgi:hypothetical protein
MDADLQGETGLTATAQELTPFHQGMNMGISWPWQQETRDSWLIEIHQERIVRKMWRARTTINWIN